MKCKVNFKGKTSAGGGGLGRSKRKVNFKAKTSAYLRQKALRGEAESFQSFGWSSGGSDILFALQTVVPLFQERSQQ